MSAAGTTLAVTFSFVTGYSGCGRRHGLDLGARVGERPALSEPAFHEHPAGAAAFEPGLARVVVGGGLDAGEHEAFHHIVGTQTSTGNRESCR